MPLQFSPRSYTDQFQSEQYPRLSVYGQRYAMLPESDLHDLKRLQNELKNIRSNRFGWGILAAFAGVIGLSLVIAMVSKMLAPEVVTVEKPVIVERQVPVSNNCLIFCK